MYPKSTGRRAFVFCSGIVVLAFVVYWRTLLPTVSTWGDSAKFQYIAQVWGIPHPTGYPVYILLTRLFSLLPWGDVAYRVNLLSACCASLAVGILFLVARQVSGDDLAAAAAALILAFCPIFWSQSVVAEVYALNAVWVSLCLTLILHWRAGQISTPREPRTWALYAFMLVYGFSFSHHVSMILLLPAFVYWVARHAPATFTRPRNLLVGVAAVVLGLAPYSYILLRASQGAAVSEFPGLLDSTLIAAFLDYVSGAQFRSGFFTALGENPIAFAQRVIFYTQLLLQQFGWGGICLGAAGLFVVWRQGRSLAIGLVLALLGEVVFPLGYNVIDPEVFFIPSFMIWALFIAAGLALLRRGLLSLWQRIPIRGKVPAAGEKPIRIGDQIPNLLFPVICGALVALSLFTHWAAADRSRDVSARRWAEAFLQNVEPNAAIVLPQPYYYSQKQILLYMMLAEGNKPELKFIQRSEIGDWIDLVPVYLYVWMPDVAEEYTLHPVDSSRQTLSGFLAGLPEGVIVIVAVKDEASTGLTDEAAAAWQLVGGQRDVKGCFRCGHALIGIKGAATGQAMEDAGPHQLWLHVKRGDEIGSTSVRAPVDISVQSAGFDAGNEAQVWIGKRQVSPNQRGYNVVVIDPGSGGLVSSVSVDTFETDLVDNVRLYRVLPR